MNNKPTTIGEWLLLLPIDEATAALNNMGTNIVSQASCSSLSKAVSSFMYWKHTEEGVEYWGYIYTRELKKETNANI